MVRKIRGEALLLSDGTVYEQRTTTDWVTKTTKTLTLDEDALIHFEFQVKYYGEQSSNTYLGGNVRMLVDNVPVFSTGELYRYQGGGITTLTLSGFLYLSAGQHIFAFQISVFRNNNPSTQYIQFYNIKIRKLKFSDTQYLMVDSGSKSAANAAEITVTDLNITLPARKLAVGRIKQYPVRIMVYVEGVNNRCSVLKNPGESDDSGKLNWKIFINNTQASWTDRSGDSVSPMTDNIGYSEGARGYYEAYLGAEQTVNIKVKVYNAVGSSQTVRAVVSVVACAWIIGSGSYEPISLMFPQGSTLYLVLEPLSGDPTKTIQLGKPRAWDLGYNYYSTASGTGILSWNYTFESVEVSSCALIISGLDGCVSIIAVDVRG
jgi:hypothetical protein